MYEAFDYSSYLFWQFTKNEIPFSRSPIKNKIGMSYRERKSYKIPHCKFLSFFG